MNIKELLKSKKCSCGVEHSCDIKDVIIESGAVNKVKDLIGDYKKIVLVADSNTYPLCGDNVKEQIGDKLSDIVLYKTEGLLVPNEDAVSKLNEKLNADADLIIGIGSGVLQDLCKYVSFEHSIPYFIVATAPSMDGYASKGAAMIMGGMKVTYNAHVPTAVIGDTDILKNAPIDMIKSGYGDILGKYSCLNDWKLAHVINNEYICEYVYDLTYDMLNKIKDLGELLLKRDDEAIKTLMEALIGVGIAMAYIGNSRPASGSEHHLSHFFEIVGILNNEPYFMHGTDVAYSAVYTEKIREKLLKIDVPVQKTEFNEEKWEEKIREIYGKASDGVIALQKKAGWYKLNQIDIFKEKWAEIKKVLRDAPSSCDMIKYLDSIGLDISEFEKMYGEKKIQDALFFAKDIKDRYSVLWLYYILCY